MEKNIITIDSISKKYVLAIDQGTTSTKAIVFDNEMNKISHASAKHRQIYPKQGYVSHDAKEIYKNTVSCMKTAISNAGLTVFDISAIGITNQRETTVVWDKATGEPICDAVVWLCRRTEDICKKIIDDGMTETIRSKTGLLPNPYFSATKIQWILENSQEAQESLQKKNLLFGTMDSYIIYRLTGGQSHITDHTNASRTMLYNIHEGTWDEELLEYFNIPREIMPQIVSSAVKNEPHCCTAKGIFDTMIPISGIAGDQHAALFGQGCFEPCDIKNTYGTGCFILMNTGDKPSSGMDGLLTTLAYSLDNKITYALEGTVFCAGAILEWLINNAGMLTDISELEGILKNAAAKTPSDYSGDNNDLYFVPAFTGLSAPHWDMEAKANILNMTLATTRAHIIKSAVDSIAYQSKDAIDYLIGSAKMTSRCKAIRVDGGITNSDYLMQFQSDMLDLPIILSEEAETTAMGAALLGGYGVGMYSSLKQIKELIKTEKTYLPKMGKDEREYLYKGWLNAVEKTKNHY